MQLRGIMRTIKDHVEAKAGEKVSDDAPIIPWLVEHAGRLLSRCQRGRDGRTPHERLHGKRAPQHMVPF